ncbi:Inh inhibitor of prohead protease gp21 [Aeromonas phage 65]|uniref:Protein inh n=2 Tax=Ishigurovirus osborne TaxID=260149 RepID=A0A219YCP0_9CAUD|nr:minor head protein inhibitor of protease [Aeromonas phage 65]ADQ53085.1 Inh inhibitor of prohead protease gp21 [Aeromonas phage 65]APU01463.1 protein inh [Aeromonas phage 65.2]
MARKKEEELKELDLGVINEIIEENSAPDAKVKIQVYAKECGFKIGKSNISVDDMVVKLLEMADAKENQKLEYSPLNKIKTPEVYSEVKQITPEEELELAEDIEQFDPVVEEKEPFLNPGEVVSINDIPEDIKTEIVDAIKSGEVVITAPTSPIEEVITGIHSYVPSLGTSPWFPPEQPKEIEINFEPDLSGFTPRINLIGAVGQQYMNCPYWILDWILENGKDWKTKIETHPRETDHPILKTVLYYIQIHGSVTVRESRNSRYHTLY